MAMVMRLPTADVIRYRDCSTVFIEVGAADSIMLDQRNCYRHLSCVVNDFVGVATLRSRSNKSVQSLDRPGPLIIAYNAFERKRELN